MRIYVILSLLFLSEIGTYAMWTPIHHNGGSLSPFKRADDTMDLVDHLLDDIKTAITDIKSQHLKSTNDFLNKQLLVSNQIPSYSLSPHTKTKRNNDLSKRSTQIPRIPLVSLAVLGNMKQFFTDLKKSLKSTQKHDFPAQEIYKPKAYRNHQERPTQTQAPSFAFPQHIRRMMFGYQQSQPYAHSGLGRR